jgi:hypothetical protein
LVSSPGVDGLITDDPSIEAYTNAIRHLLDDPDRRLQIARGARTSIETTWPDWTDVLAQDLLPVWQDVRTRFCETWRMTHHSPMQIPAPCRPTL